MSVEFLNQVAMKKNKTITILIAEDHPILREKYVEILAPLGIETIGQAVNGRQVLSLLRSIEPDVILLDLNMPLMDGNETMTKVLERHPNSRIVILSHHNSDLLIDDYLKRGAKGYLPKELCDADTLEDTIRRVYAGETAVVRSDHADEQLRQMLTRRQQEIIPLICEGLTNKQIGVEINLTERAVEKQRQKLYQKTNTHNLSSFLAYAIREGLHFLGKKKPTPKPEM